MSVSNGTAMPAILRLGDCTPKRRPVEIIRDDKPVTLQAYVYGPRCPTVVKCEVAAAYDTWLDSALNTDTPVEEWPRRERSKLTASYQQYLRDCILALVPGLEFEEADALSSDAGDEDGKAKQLLIYLEYMKPTVASDDDDAEGEAVADDNPPPNQPKTVDPLTLDPSLPTSLPATESGSRTGSRSRNA